MIIESAFLEKKVLKGEEVTSLYAGASVRKIGYIQLVALVKQVHKELKKHPHKMLQYSSAELLESIYEGRAAYIRGEDRRLLAFAQVWPYIPEKDEQYYPGYGLSQEKEVFEVGSWLSFERGGYGRRVLEAVVTMWRKQYPQAHVISIIEEDNERAEKIIIGIRGKQIGVKRTFRVSDKQGNQARMKIFEMNFVLRHGDKPSLKLAKKW